MPAAKREKSFQVLNYVQKGAVAEIRLNRPEAMNAFNIELATELGQALKRAAQDKAVRAVVIRGEGKSFSAGGDLKMFHAQLPQPAPAFRKITNLLNAAIQSIRTMPKPVVVGVHGPAFAAAFGLTLACDLIVASHSARFSASYLNIALCPNGSASLFLPRLVGFHRANELFFTTRILSAFEAFEWGIVNRVSPDEEFDATLEALAQDLASRPTRSIARAKLLLNQSLGLNWKKQLENEREAIAWSSTTPDFAEGVSAFVEKRRPQFQGVESAEGRRSPRAKKNR